MEPKRHLLRRPFFIEEQLDELFLGLEVKRKRRVDTKFRRRPPVSRRCEELTVWPKWLLGHLVAISVFDEEPTLKFHSLP